MQKAYEEGRKAVDFAPRNLTARANLVWYAIGAGKFEVAEKEFQEVMKLNPQFADAWVPLALARLAHDRPREAEKTYLELSSRDERAASLAAIGLADLALYEGRLKEARKILDEGIEADLKNDFQDEANLKTVMLAQTLLAQGNKDAALRAADRIASSSRKGSDLFSVARLYIQAGQSENALKIAADLNVKPQAELQAYARLIEGEAARKKTDIPGAIELYQKAQSLQDTWLGHLALGCAYLDAAQFIESHSEFDTCLKRKGEATAVFLDDFPSYRYFAPVYYYLGQAQEGLKSPAAKESYQRFLKIKERADPGDPMIDDARQQLKNF
jgi:tetratricopeptide (TPR) repeat protein